jgi:hypothetical protein
MIKPFAAVLCVVLPALLPGCSEQPAPQLRPRGLLPGEEVPRGPGPQLVPKPAAPTPAAAPQPSSLTSPFAPAAPDPGALARPQPVAPAAAVVEDAAVDEVAPTPSPSEALTTRPRDLPSELTALLGQPGSCLDLAAVASAGGRTTISITVSVMPSGRILRASASAPNQAAEALRCLEQRASAGSFRGPVPSAPLEVTATIPIEVVAQPQAR